MWRIFIYTFQWKARPLLCWTASTFIFTVDYSVCNLEATNTHKDWLPIYFVANIIVGFDSDDGKHSAGLAFNTFSERLYVSGEGGNADSFEQPFDSLDFTYTYYILEDLSVKLKAKNLLDANNEITQEDNDGADVTRFEQEVGQSYSVSVSYKF